MASSAPSGDDSDVGSDEDAPVVSTTGASSSPMRQKPGRIVEGRLPRTMVNLPIRPFLYTLDQIATLIGVSLNTVKTVYVYFDGRTTGSVNGRMVAHNLVANQAVPTVRLTDWRVDEQELIRFMVARGWVWHDAAYVTSSLVAPVKPPYRRRRRR